MKYKQFVVELVYGKAGMLTQNTRELHRSLQSPLPICCISQNSQRAHEVWFGIYNSSLYVHTIQALCNFVLLCEDGRLVYCKWERTNLVVRMGRFFYYICPYVRMHQDYTLLFIRNDFNILHAACHVDVTRELSSIQWHFLSS